MLNIPPDTLVQIPPNFPTFSDVARADHSPRTLFHIPPLRHDQHFPKFPPHHVKHSTTYTCSTLPKISLLNISAVHVLDILPRTRIQHCVWGGGKARRQCVIFSSASSRKQHKRRSTSTNTFSSRSEILAAWYTKSPFCYF